MKIFIGLLFLMPALSLAQNENLNYPRAATIFVDTELPKAATAVNSDDREKFGEYLRSTEAFLKKWGMGMAGTTEVSRYPNCTDAVTDYLIVALCRGPNGDKICDATTFIPRFEQNLKACRELASR